MVNTPSRIVSTISGGHSVTKMIKKLWNDESGAAAAEYALILAIVGSGIALAAFTLGGAISNAMNSASDCINNGATAGTC